MEINGELASDLSHEQAVNLMKNSTETLNLRLKR